MNTQACFAPFQYSSQSLSHLDSSKSVGFRSAQPGNTDSRNVLDLVKQAYCFDRVKESAFLRR